MGVEVNNPSGGGGGASISALVFTPIVFAEGSSAFGAPYEIPGWAIDAQSQVHLRGLLNPGATPENNVLVFTLPAECHPKKKKPLTCGDANTIADICTLMVEPNGEVKLLLGASGAPLPILDGKIYDLQ